jgi:hypothetical protein
VDRFAVQGQVLDLRPVLVDRGEDGGGEGEVDGGGGEQGDHYDGDPPAPADLPRRGAGRAVHPPSG